MSGEQWGSLAYLGLLGAVLVFWYFVQDRANLGRKVQYLVLWGLIFLGVIAAAGLWDDIRQTARPGQTVFAAENRVELPRSPDGHYYVVLEINAVPIRFVVDTGATGMVLSRSDAARAGLNPEEMVFLGEALTANGTVRTATVTLDSVALGPFRDARVQAFVNGGDLAKSLLGMSYLQRFDRLEISGGKMILERG